MIYAILGTMKTVHDRLIEARKAAGYATAQEAADSMGIRYPTYAGHENGSAGIRSPVLARYAKKFGVSVDWLLTGLGTPKVNQSSIDRRLQQFKLVEPDLGDELADTFNVLLDRAFERSGKRPPE